MALLIHFLRCQDIWLSEKFKDYGTGRYEICIYFVNFRVYQYFGNQIMQVDRYWIIGMMHYSGIKSCSSMWGKLYTFWFLCWQLVKAMLIRSCLAKIFWQGGQVKSIQLLTTYSILYFRSPGIVSWMLNYHQCQHLPYQMRVSSSAILGKVKSFQIGKIVPKTLFNTACFEESLNRASWVLRQRQYMFRACVCNLSRHCTSLI